MNLSDLVKAAADAVNAGRDTITLVIPGAAGKTGRKKLVPRGKAPVGEVLCEQQRHGGRAECVCAFNSLDVLAFLTAKGLVTATVQGTREVL